MGLREKVEEKRRQQAEQQAPAALPAPMSEVQSPDIAKAEQALENYREAQEPPAVDESTPNKDDPVAWEFPGGRTLRSGRVIHDKVAPRPAKEVLTVARGVSTTDMQWQGLKEWLTEKGFLIQAVMPK